MNGNYSIPAKDGKYDCLHALLRGMLTVDPTKRFTVADVLERLAAVAETKGFSMKGPITVKKAEIELASPERSLPPPLPDQPPQHPPPPVNPDKGLLPAGSQGMTSSSHYQLKLLENNRLAG